MFQCEFADISWGAQCQACTDKVSEDPHLCEQNLDTTFKVPNYTSRIMFIFCPYRGEITLDRSYMRLLFSGKNFLTMNTRQMFNLKPFLFTYFMFQGI